MKQSDWLKRIEKRELRIQYRAVRLEREQKMRAYKKEDAEKEAHARITAAKILQEDNRKTGKHCKPGKKPGPGKFLALYSFIPSTHFDARHSIPSSWKPRSFNERNQHFEFLKSFVYPYPLPEILLWVSHLPEYIIDSKGARNKTPDFIFIRLAKQWILDISSGESFYKRNKQFFTKAEAHYFLSSKLPFSDSSSVIKLYFFAKCRARSLSHKLSMMVADVFAVKFTKHFKNKIVDGFLDLIARTPEYGYEQGMLGDISDFVLTKIAKKKENFSFSGRTITSVIALANEWHEWIRRNEEAHRVQREAQMRERQLNRNDKKPIDTSHWKGIGISQFRHKTEECIWTVTEIITAQDLVNEGRKMKNCVASYCYKCASGQSSIFSVERVFPVSQVIEKVATLEVHASNRSLIQAKGKCNSAITPKVKSVITRWAQANSIKVQLSV